jgi:hypothetical protein
MILGEKISESDFKNQYGTKIEKDTDKILEKTKKRIHPSLLQTLTFFIQQWYYRSNIQENSYDYQYWSGKGWLQANRAYYTDQKVGISKRILSRVFGRLIIQFILK